ncbi:uncharacterized protein LOC124543679 [Vanessa cardui]|uniref:uncharacterized protein LOC124543679 n=1 Tax=Vanessa cardui TaxID=171605 RepID=UPI001F1406B0|nr:uncharacterized protein LOC124543679 [Vanessa cardui]
MLKTSVIIFIFCVVIDIDCYNYESGRCYGCRPEYTIMRRSKHYPSSPFKFYNRPPFSPPIRGPFSYTPPPGYTANDIGPPISSNARPYKVSKKPTNEGLGDEDINNLFKYLSKKDLDKIVKYANEKERSAMRYREPSDNSNYEYSPDFNNNDNIPKQAYEKILNGPDEYRSHGLDNDSSNVKYESSQFAGPVNNYQPYSQRNLDGEASMHQSQFSFLDAHIQRQIEDMSFENRNRYTDGITDQEELLPRPTNLRNDDYDISFTNDVPSVVKPESSSYKLENFADLPLMGYENSKLHSVNSYNVPHYSVTSNLNPSNQRPFNKQLSSSTQFSKPSSHNNEFEVEPAPPASAAKDQSDAHLKAIKIWTHKSKGTAYTLHDDGTLSLEKPTRPKFEYH